MGVTVIGFPKDRFPIYGVPEVLRCLRGVPEGSRIRFRFRSKDWAKVFIKTPSGIEEYFVMECGSHWEFDIKQGQNLRIRL